jgi:hypothetical protein
MVIVYLHSDAASDLDWENAVDRNAKVLAHPESIEYSPEEFAEAFNTEIISDLGYIAIKEK